MVIFICVLISAKPPSVTGLEKLRVEEGSKVRLNCHLTGNPIPWVEWYKDGKMITSKGRLRVKTKRRTSKLVIRRVRPSDRGVYECRAGNVVQKQSVSSSATLTVARKRTTKKPSPSPPSTSTLTSTLTTTQSSPWTTEPCPVADFCLNGGTCIFYKDVREYVCHCAEGYVGLRCNYKDVGISLGGVKNLDPNHDRLFIAIVVLFLVFFCLNWACLGLCWLCCFRRQPNNWEKFREMAPLRKFFKSGKLSNMEEASEDVAMELTSSHNNSNEEK
ncbi:uncharacterized protein LOC118189064 isoform X2 [Stegodyphus dumicola]|uniref:uncharacterized protein LOC118189064 isoform X2 n=1 Tax=Stegodyphus dumicola TaxID=202533 RepID=UPI0015A82A78|nr:uncharacterized protein LOC118189064 isoform X2 [Stegodyphus dumicola]